MCQEVVSKLTQTMNAREAELRKRKAWGHGPEGEIPRLAEDIGEAVARQAEDHRPKPIDPSLRRRG
jgi:hypothetical protein